MYDKKLDEFSDILIKDCLDTQKRSKASEVWFTKMRAGWWYNPYMRFVTPEKIAHMSNQEILDDILTTLNVTYFRTKFLCGKAEWLHYVDIMNNMVMNFSVMPLNHKWLIRPGTITKLENYYLGIANFYDRLIPIVLSDRFDLDSFEFIESEWNVPLEEEFNVRNLGFDVWKRTLNDSKGIYPNKSLFITND